MEQLLNELQMSAQDVNGVQMVPLHLALVAVQEAAVLNIMSTVENLQKDIQDTFEQDD